MEKFPNYKEIIGHKATQNVWCRRMMEINGWKEQTKSSGSGHWEHTLMDEHRETGFGANTLLHEKQKRENKKGEKKRHRAQET